MVRPQLWLRVAGPVCIAAGLLGAAAGLLPALALVPLGAALLPALVVRLDVDARSFRLRRLRGWDPPVALDSVVALRLRRIPVAPLRTMRRAHRWGRFCSVPLRLRLVSADRMVLQLTVAWWGQWGMLARLMASRPAVQIDGRSRARLAKYVG